MMKMLYKMKIFYYTCQVASHWNDWEHCYHSLEKWYMLILIIFKNNAKQTKMIAIQTIPKIIKPTYFMWVVSYMVLKSCDSKIKAVKKQHS